MTAQLTDPKMPIELEAYDGVRTEVDGRKMAASDSPERLLAAQLEIPESQRLKSSRASTSPPSPRSSASRIDAVHEVGLLERQGNGNFHGPIGVGQADLAISGAISASAGERGTHSGILSDMADSVEETKVSICLTAPARGGRGRLPAGDPEERGAVLPIH